MIVASQEDRQVAQLAFGRIWGMLQRPERAGDVSEYERCRLVVLTALDPDNSLSIAAARRIHDYGRDRLKGAQGD